VTGPTTAAELVDLAVAELHQPQRQTAAPTAAATALDLAAGWPAFSWCSHRLITALHNDPSGVGTTPPEPPASAGTPDRNLQRAADYLGAAADLLDTRDRRARRGRRT